MHFLLFPSASTRKWHRTNRNAVNVSLSLSRLPQSPVLITSKLRSAKRQSTTQGSAISHQPQQEQFIQRRIKSHLVDLEKDNYIKPGGGNLLRRNEDEEEEQKSGEISSPPSESTRAELREMSHFGIADSFPRFCVPSTRR